MKLKLVALLLISTTPVLSQGLNTEIGFNDNYDQSARALVCVDEYSYMARLQMTSSFFTTSALHKIDTSGNELWVSAITPLPAEYINVHEMIPSEEKGVYVLGDGLPTCDIAQDCFWFIQKFDSTGNVAWSRTWVNNTCLSPTYLTGLSLNENDQLLVNFADTALNSIVYTIENNGVLIDSLFISTDQLNGICELPGHEFIAYKGDSLFAINNSGVISDTILFSKTIQGINSLNDSLYVLTQDSIFIFDTNLNLIQGSDVQGHSWYSNLKVAPGKVRLVSSGAGIQSLLELDKQLQIVNVTAIPSPVSVGVPKDFSDSHFSVSYDFPLTLHRAIRFMDHSLSSMQNAPVNNSDIGVINVNVTQVSLQPQPSSGVYQYQVWAEALVKNYGANVLNTCRINHRIQPFGICSEIFYTNEFTNLGLAPSDSTWINLGLVHSSINFFTDTIDLDLCVYTSHPNQVTDTIVPNDQFCKYVYLGSVGINGVALSHISIFPNPTTDDLHIENPGLNDLTIMLYNGTGQLIKVDRINDRESSLDLSTYSKGIYLIKVISGDNAMSKIIQKI